MITTNLLYALGTLAIWLGWFMLLRGVWFGFQLFTGPATTRDASRRAVLSSMVLAALGLALGWLLPPMRESSTEGVWRLPIVWFVMPFTAWGAVVSLLMMGVRFVQGAQALNGSEASGKYKAAGIWLLVAVGFSVMYFREPENTIEVLKGGIPFGVTTALVTLLLLVAGVGAMAFAARSTATRGFAKGIVVQAALIAGSFVFGLPFAYLLITSFKEDRDMSSPEGIIWVPRVTERVDYFDPRQPMYEASLNGQRVEGVIIEELDSDRVKIDIYRPLSIRGVTMDTLRSELKEVPRKAEVVTAITEGTSIRGIVIEDFEDGRKKVKIQQPAELKDQERIIPAGETEPVRHIGLNVRNYPESLSYLPPETQFGLVYLKNTLLLVVLSIIGTLFSSSIVSYAFSRMRFPGRGPLFSLMLATMMLPGAVTLLPQFLIFRSLGWIDTLYPLWVPAFFGSAFNIFLLRQFFMNIPMELEDAAKIDGCSYLRTFWSIMLPQIKPALAVIFIWTFMGAWNNFMGPLIYINSPENMPLSYALQLFASDRGGEPGYLMAFATLTMVPVLAIFFFFQRYFIEGVALSGLGGR
jgi:multiple sugar transport system permease protein